MPKIVTKCPDCGHVMVLDDAHAPEPKPPVNAWLITFRCGPCMVRHWLQAKRVDPALGVSVQVELTNPEASTVRRLPDGTFGPGDMPWPGWAIDGGGLQYPPGRMEENNPASPTHSPRNPA